MSAHRVTEVPGVCGIPPETLLDKTPSEASPPYHCMLCHAEVDNISRLWSATMVSGAMTSASPSSELNSHPETWVLLYRGHAEPETRCKREPDGDESAMIRIGFDPDAGTWSTVGMRAVDIPMHEPTMNFAWIRDSPVVSTFDRGTILHEWGHALGLVHEHQRASPRLLDRIYPYLDSTQHVSIELIKSQVLDVYNNEDVSNHAAFDEKSVMRCVPRFIMSHFRGLTQVRRCFMPGAFNAQNVEVMPNSELSELDKAAITIAYSTRKMSLDKPLGWSLQRALIAEGVPSREQQQILNIQTNRNNHVQRYFSRWRKQVRGPGVALPEESSKEGIPVELLRREFDTSVLAVYSDSFPPR
ncbi:hypothetical protein DXG01_007743 [Tephrocybe rancida]|nr:hypothetical protein DXG01_007743 [Tephrocybe rancida]